MGVEPENRKLSKYSRCSSTVLSRSQFPPCQKMCDKILMCKKYRAHTLGFFSVKKICWQHPFGFSVFRAHKNI